MISAEKTKQRRAAVQAAYHRWKNHSLIYRDLFFLTLVAVLIGALAGLINALFGHVLLVITDMRTAHVYQLVPLLGLVGLIMVWCNQRFGGLSNKGMSLIFAVGHGARESIPLRLIPFSMISTWLTHLFGGSAGREGVAIQIGGTIANGISRRFPIRSSQRILLIAGIAAGFAGLFRTPIAATFFAIEVLAVGVLAQEAILPALAAAYTASYVSGLLGLEQFSFALTDEIKFSWLLVPQLILMGVAFGITGGAFSFCLHKTKALLSQWIKNPLLRIFLVGLAISGLSLLCWAGRYSGLGTNLIAMSFGQGIYSWDFALKFLFTVLTLAAGFQGGEVTPLFSIGASLGVFLASLIGLPPAFAAALGYVAVFGSATNTLITPILIGVEVFGVGGSPYFVAVCVIAYVCNGNLSIYPLQKPKKPLP